MNLPRTFVVKRILASQIRGGAQMMNIDGELVRLVPDMDTLAAFLNSPVFVIGNIFASGNKVPKAERKNVELKLPFKSVIYELNDFMDENAGKKRHGWYYVLAIQEDDWIYLSAYTERNDQPLRFYAVAVAYNVKDHRLTFNKAFDDGKSMQMDKRYEDNAKYLCDLSRLAIMVGNHPRTSSRSDVVPASRRGLGAVSRRVSHTGWEYRLLSIEGPPSGTGQVLGGTHASPRWHVRRGHWRRVAPDRTVWVASCEVGSKERGGVVHDYQVPEGAPA